MKNHAHLDMARLLAIRDGDTADIPAVEHLVSCERCQQAFDDTRWLALLGRLRSRAQDDQHPDPDELVAYRSRALSPARLTEIGRHLRGCDRCLATFRRERLEDRAQVYSSPSPKLFAQVQRQFRPQLRQLGTVLVRRFKQRLAVFFVPEPAAVGSGMARLCAMPVEPPTDRTKEQPGSARRRVRRLEAREEMDSEQTDLEQELTDELTGEEAYGAVFDLMAERVGPIKSALGGTAMIHAGDHHLVLEPGPAGDAAGITLTLSSTDSDAPVAGIRVLSALRKGEPQDVRTDPDGKATLRLMPGRSEITVHAIPPFRFRLEFPD